MPTYNKLVRDRIPEVIEKSGKKFRTEILDANTYEKELRVKLKEEMDELLQAESIEARVEEMADLLEVLYSLSRHDGVEPEEIERVRQRKYDERGGFQEKILLIDVEDD
ncbi:nucleoside triphosphate pyrophosphohydrolase [Halalkalibacter alkaliphilus]|uniref:Nucleoside triphosphate pyrophosphohydrolase n=1 Tax=Halalkalibacter alkaliphilus TaxID=2917993 RepID=A0A9X2I5Q9_9BACI|nr:nucleoside triphosphate pyrophosphohydrolase [Halalkalibacter alkaliphilus]MCL7748776.1 nucleoside triphosphate pyrophosphohydrolase [Halalkalibacter alkaliphilus]